MSQPTRKIFSINQAFPEGTWYTDVSRFFRLAHQQCALLERTAKEVNAAWPKPLGESLKEGEGTPELNLLVEQRDMASDVARIFAAMAVEAFLNFYGAARIGEEEYATHFERLGLIPKLRQLLLLCDGISISEKDPLVKALNTVAASRNLLVHHKARKLVPEDDAAKYMIKIPGEAQSSIKAMDNFFAEFRSIVPESKYFLPLEPPHDA